MRILSRLVVSALMVSSAIANAQDTTAPDVQIRDDGGSLTLSNGLATAVIDKRKGQVVSIALPGGHNLVSHGGVTFDAEAFGRGKNEAGIRGGDPVIVSKGPDMVEVKFVDPGFINLMAAEMHFVMRRGVPGVYEYLVMRHGPGLPAGEVGQLRWVFRGDARLLTRAYASATKQGQMVEQDAFAGSKFIADATFSLTQDVGQHIYTEPVGHTYAGLPVYSKYDWSDYLENHVVHGFSSNTEGIFMVQPSVEYCNGGPAHAVLTVHNGPVCILEFLAGHFLIRDGISDHFTEGEQWQQIVGPWLVYVNKGASPAELWADAWRRGQQEKAQWPYAWVAEDEALYPKNRGTVAGTLRLPGPLPNALVVLASPEKDWQTQTMGYEFWTRADAAGRFSISKVRPGNYALYASVPGLTGEIKVPDVNVGAGQVTQMGSVPWTAPVRSELLWRLGTPDRSTAEFRFGNEPRQFGLWWQYLKEMGTRDVNFTIGKSDPARDWYYAQCVLPMPDGSLFSPTWNIHFNVAGAPPAGPCVLTVDLAGAAGGSNHLQVAVNGHAVGDINSPNDSGVYRSAVRSANFRHNEIQFDPALLQPGENKISFHIETRGGWKKGAQQAAAAASPDGSPASPIAVAADQMPELPSVGVMYDCVQLEAGPVVTGH